MVLKLLFMLKSLLELVFYTNKTDGGDDEFNVQIQ